MKKRNRFITGIIICFFLNGCSTNVEPGEIKIYGYSIGDTLSDKFEVVMRQDYPFSRAVLIDDNRYEVSLIDDFISAIHLSKLSEKEYQEYKKKVIKMIGFDPEFYDKDTPYGVKINGDMFYWNDKLTGNEVVLGRSSNEKDSVSYLSVYNRNISDYLLNIYAPEIDTCSYEILDIKY
jgi:hypothetical protein